MEKVYLAIPYSHRSEVVRESRFELANQIAAYLIDQGFNVLSPISHSHPIAKYMDNHNESVFWTKMDIEWLACCDKMIVVKTVGWKLSSGIKDELRFADATGIPVYSIDPDTMVISDGV